MTADSVSPCPYGTPGWQQGAPWALMNEQPVSTLCPHLLKLRGGREMLKKEKAEREQRQPTPSVGTHHQPWLQSLSSHTASGAWCFLADLTHCASTPFWNPLSKQKQALLEKCINPGKSPDDNIIHFLMLFSDPSLGGPSLPASSYSRLI